MRIEGENWRGIKKTLDFFSINLVSYFLILLKKKGPVRGGL
jgi:hypothetical protein